MKTVNTQQSHLVRYIDKYQSLIKEIGDCITDYQAGYGFGHVLKPDGTEPSFLLHTITQEEHDWLIFNFCTLLDYDLHNHIPKEQAKEIREKIDKADTILFSLLDKAGYKKYSDSIIVSQDLKTLMDAFIATEKILDVIMPGKKQTEPGSDSKVKETITIDAIDEKLIQISQKYETEKTSKLSLRFPSLRTIKKLLKAKGIDISHPAIGGRLKRLREAGIIPKTTRNKEKSYDPDIIEQTASDGRAKKIKSIE